MNREERNARRFSIPLAMIYETRHVAARRDIGSTLLDARYESPVIIIIIIIIVVVVVVAANDAYLTSISLVGTRRDADNERSTSA